MEDITIIPDLIILLKSKLEQYYTNIEDIPELLENKAILKNAELSVFEEEALVLKRRMVLKYFAIDAEKLNNKNYIYWGGLKRL